MANANTIASQLAGTIQNTLAPLSSAVIGTTETAFLLNGSSVTPVSGGGLIALTVPSVQSVIGAVTNPGIYEGTGRAFKIRAFGSTVSSASPTLTLGLYVVPQSVIAAATLTSTSFTGATKVAVSSARSIAAGSFSFVFDTQFQFSATGVLQGQRSAEINDLLDVFAATTAATLTGEQDLNFFLTAALSSGSALTTLSLNEFSVEQV